jgi:hypothetical protein
MSPPGRLCHACSILQQETWTGEWHGLRWRGARRGNHQFLHGQYDSTPGASLDLPRYRLRDSSNRLTRCLAHQRAYGYTGRYIHRMVREFLFSIIQDFAESQYRNLFRDFRFIVLFLAGAIATFPLFVPPFFLPLYSNSVGLSSSAGAGLVAGFNFSSAIGRLGCGLMSDAAGPLNTLFLSLVLSAGSMLILWPVSNTLGPLIAFVIINGIANGGFFATMPTVVGNVFGSARVSVARDGLVVI